MSKMASFMLLPLAESKAQSIKILNSSAVQGNDPRRAKAKAETLSSVDKSCHSVFKIKSAWINEFSWQKYDIGAEDVSVHCA